MTESELGISMLNHARSENKKSLLPINPQPLPPLSNNALTVLSLCARKGGVKRTFEIAQITGLNTLKIAEAQRVLMSRSLIRPTGEKRLTVLHATETGRKALREAGIEAGIISETANG